MAPGSYITIAVVLGVGLILFLVERAAPLRRATWPLVARLVVNLALSGLAFATVLLVVRPALDGAWGFSAERPFGIVHLGVVPDWLRPVVGFLLMDLSFYYWHRLNHRVRWLWRFHNVHHFDHDLDVSTAFRFHFGEIALSAGLRAVQVLVIGLSVWTYAVYEIVFQANTLFHHSNVRLPIGFERLLNRLLVTPRMHGIHHSQVEHETHSNYGVVFPWWDRLHRTLGLAVPQAAITIGVPGYSRAEDQGLVPALLAPFRPQRDYWRRPDGSVPTRDPETEEGDRHRLAE